MREAISCPACGSEEWGITATEAGSVSIYCGECGNSTVLAVPVSVDHRLNGVFEGDT